MIESLISTVLGGISWVTGIFRAVAGFFHDISDGVIDIPIVGGLLSGFFAGISSLFDSAAGGLSAIGGAVSTVLYAIDAWLEELADLWSAVYGWIADKVHDAYTWATNAWDWIVDTGQQLWSAVYGWISDKLHDAYTWATNALDWIVETGQQLWNDVYGWISDKLDDAYHWATDAWDWIVDNAPKIAELPELIRGMVMQPIAPFINLISFFFEDINLFFSDPAGYFLKKLEKLGTPFAEGLWDFVEKILERIW